MRSDVVRGGWARGGVVAAILVLLSGCARPQGIHAVTTLQPSPTPFVQHDPLTIANPVFHAGEVGVNYAPVTLSATGGVAPLHWTISVGSLPAGLELSADGIVSGTPTANGFFAFSVQVFDSGNSTAGVPTNIPITPRLTAGLVAACATECAVELGCVSVCGTFGQVSGGVAPLTYALTGGVLPAGTTLSGLTLNGTFKGLPGRLQFTVQVTDGFGVSARISPTFNMLTHISFPGGTITCFYPGCDGKYYPPKQIPYSGGVGTPAVQVTGWAVSCDFPPCGPPATPAVSVTGGYVSISVPGSSGGSGYKATLNLLLIDKSLCGAGTYCSVVAAVNVVVLSG